MPDLTKPDRSADPLYRSVLLERRTVIPVLGVPVHLASDSEAVMEAVDQAFGRWRSLAAHPALLSAGPVWVRIAVHEGDEGPAEHAPMVYRMPDAARVFVHTPGSVGLVDVSRRDAVAYVTPQLVRDRDHFCYGMLEAMVLVLATTNDRQPVHAAAVMLGGRALVLSGPPGVGKSTIAYALVQRGARPLADDAVYVQLHPTFRLWGAPGRGLLPEDAARHFPELEGRLPQHLPSGKRKLVVSFGAAHEQGPPIAEAATVVMLARHDGPPALQRADATEVTQFLLEGLGPARDLYEDEGRRAIEQIAAGGGWKLTLSAEPSEALPLIDGALSEAGGAT